jgi:cyanophycinase-like exopeptidase
MREQPTAVVDIPACSWRGLLGPVLSLVLSSISSGASADKPYRYYVEGDPSVRVNVTAPAAPSYVLMGGGPDVDEAFRWMIGQAGITASSGGRLVVIRASGDGAYNPYIYYSNAASSTAPEDIVDGWVGGASLGLTSVETLVIPSVQAANEPFVNSVVSKANAVWIAGGDQSNYINFWKGQALETSLKLLMSRNVPIGGTSAGLAVLGQFDFAALRGSVTSEQALNDPYNKYMTLDPNPLSTRGGFIAPPALANTILDSHLDSRDRMGRLIAFVSRLIRTYPGPGNQTYGCTGGILSNSEAQGIGLSVETALLVEGNPSGKFTARRVTNVSTTSESAVYFISVTQGPTLCAPDKPLAIATPTIEIRKLDDSRPFNLSNWSSYPVYKYGGAAAGVLLPTDLY